MNLHLTTAVIDSSKIKDFMDCARKYFFLHVLGWKLDQPNHNLHFGKCWHTALDVLYTYGFDEDALQLAQATFYKEYRELFDDITDEIYFPKTPAMAAEGLEIYYKFYKEESKQWEMVYTEIGGYVPIFNEHKVYFRIDQLARHKDSGIYKIREYKTSGRFDRMWRDQWLLSTQIGTYTNLLYSLYKPEEVYGVIVEGAVFQKKGIRIEPVNCRRTPEQMLAYLSDTTYWCNCIKLMYGAIQQVKDEELFEANCLSLFPRNTQSCTKYFGCEFHDYCSVWANPLKYGYDPPVGFKVEFWDPTNLPIKFQYKVEEGAATCEKISH